MQHAAVYHVVVCGQTQDMTQAVIRKHVKR